MTSFERMKLRRSRAGVENADWVERCLSWRFRVCSGAGPSWLHLGDGRRLSLFLYAGKEHLLWSGFGEAWETQVFQAHFCAASWGTWPPCSAACWSCSLPGRVMPALEISSTRKPWAVCRVRVVAPFQSLSLFEVPLKCALIGRNVHIGGGMRKASFHFRD